MDLEMIFYTIAVIIVALGFFFLFLMRKDNKELDEKIQATDEEKSFLRELKKTFFDSE